MKTDRLIGIVMYLLNRDKVTASELAEKFEVSTRTIARDMEALSLAGIPVFSDLGMNGGYSILDTYKLGRSITTAEDYLNIISSLKGLYSAYENRKTEATLEKIMACRQTGQEQKIFMDLSIMEECINGDVICTFTVPVRERMWFSLLLGFGNEVEVLEPPELRERLLHKAVEITKLYGNDDIQLS